MEQNNQHFCHLTNTNVELEYSLEWCTNWVDSLNQAQRGDFKFIKLMHSYR